MLFFWVFKGTQIQLFDYISIILSFRLSICSCKGKHRDCCSHTDFKKPNNHSCVIQKVCGSLAWVSLQSRQTIAHCKLVERILKVSIHNGGLCHFPFIIISTHVIHKGSDTLKQNYSVMVYMSCYKNKNQSSGLFTFDQALN